jgi:polar amino acid transport system ATP-binding protein
MLRLENIVKTFGLKKILDDVSLEIKRGEIAVLLGPSGVGKSTLLRLLNNLESLDSGKIELDGKRVDLKTISQTHLSGLVFQGFNLFNHLTVLENITLALEKVVGKSKQEATILARKLLAHYNLSDKENNYPEDLSGGQKQRLAIARATALNPTILCLDEPSSALDPLLTTHVAQTIGQLAKEGYIILITTHDTTLVEQLDCTIYLMDAGKIIQSGKYLDIKAHPEQYKKIYSFMYGR